MTFASLFADLQIFAIFLLVGYLLREMLPPLQKLFLPSAVIGGLIALIGGQQCLGLWVVPKSFSSYSGTLITLIMACLIWGLRIDKQRVTGYFDYICTCSAVRYGQVFFGAIIGIALRKVWTSLPIGWGTMGIAAYYNGHGTVAAYGAVFEQLGAGNLHTGIGMIMATLGLISAVLVGMVFVNVGVRLGWANYTKNSSTGSLYTERGLIPSDKRTSLGAVRVPSSSVNSFAFQFAILLFVCWFGKMLMKTSATYVPFMKNMPSMLDGIIGAVILWPIVAKLGLGDFVDRKTCSTISGFCLELLVLSAVATLNLKLVSAFMTPILIHMAVIGVFTAIMAMWVCRKWAAKDGFEKGLMLFGMAMGAVPTGITLVRAADPDFQSEAVEAYGVVAGWNGMFYFWNPVVFPTLAVTLPWAEPALAGAITLIFLVLGYLVARKNHAVKA